MAALASRSLVWRSRSPDLRVSTWRISEAKADRGRSSLVCPVLAVSNTGQRDRGLRTDEPGNRSVSDDQMNPRASHRRSFCPGLAVA